MLLYEFQSFYHAHPMFVYSFLAFLFMKLLSDMTSNKKDDSGSHTFFSFAELICAIWFMVEFVRLINSK